MAGKARPTRDRLLLAIFALGVGIAACGDDHALQPRNRPPAILSFTATPDSLGQTDTALVVCDTADPDGDSLFYDWITDARLRIKGAHAGVYLFNSRSSQQRFYIGILRAPIDTGWVECTVRDNLGGAAQSRLLIYLHSDTTHALVRAGIRSHSAWSWQIIDWPRGR